MCEIMDEISAERERQAKYQIALSILKMDIASDEQISQATGLTVEDIKAFAAILKAPA